MEKEDPTYTLHDGKCWKETLNDGIVFFNNVKPAVQEFTAEYLNKQKVTMDKFELSESNAIKTLKTKLDTSLKTHKMYYFPKYESLWNILEIKKDADGNITLVKLVKVGSTEEKTLDNTEMKEIESLRDYVNICVRIVIEGTPGDMINVQTKLGGKLETELLDAIQGIAQKTLAMFKFFVNGEMVERETFISSLPDIKDNTTIVATTGYTTPSVFKRFKGPYEWPYWGYYGNLDCIAFIPNQNVVLYGFTIYATDQPSFEMTYKVHVDGNVVEESEVITCTDFEDKYYYRVKLKDFHEIKGGQKLEIQTKIAKNLTTNEYISCYYGQWGDQWAEVENDHMGLWTVEYSSFSNSSSVSSGNFPEIMYFV